MPVHRAIEGPDGGAPETVSAEVYLLDRRAARRIERDAAERYGIPSILLMENAARHLADVALEMVQGLGAPGILVVCGPGNNGGDGLGAARHLHNAGARVLLLCTAEPAELEGDTAINAGIVSRMGLPVEVLDPSDAAGTADRAGARLERPDLIIDAIFGTGLDRPVAEPISTLINWINAQRKNGCAVLSADLPSGLDADSGEPLGVAVRADVTVTFAGLKTGFTALAAQGYIGDVVVADIGVPRELVESLGKRLTPHADAQPSVTLRSRDQRRPGRRDLA